MKKKNYLNNKDILKEVHKSKTSYCSFTKNEYADFDIIVSSLDEITPEKVEEGIVMRRERLAVLVLEKTNDQGSIITRRKIEDFIPAVGEVTKDEVIFRVMCNDHIPVDDEKTEKAFARAQENGKISGDSDDWTDEDIAKHTKKVRLNFRPFQHWKFNESGELICVGKSHWIGDLETGEFSATHGSPTDTLATMYYQLCVRYGSKGNWRGYSYNDEMQCQALMQLIDTGLMFDESKSQNPFSYFTAILNNSFTKILNEEKTHQEIRDDLLEMHGLNPSYTRQMSSDDQ